MAPVRLTVSPSLMVAVVAEDHDADIVGFEVERHALDAAGELDHLAGLDVVEAVDAGDAVTDRQHLADFGDLGLGAEIGDLVLDDLRDFCGADIHLYLQFDMSRSGTGKSTSCPPQTCGPVSRGLPLLQDGLKD
jgi:hypothetical protein